MRRTLAFYAALLLCAFAAEVRAAETDSIRSAIENWMARYPESQYADVYKNFFQDNFGPGHILSDKNAALNYLESEVAEAGAMDGPAFEPTGSKGRFVRVNLSVIRDGIVPLDAYFSAFVNSMEGLSVPSADEWRKEWAEIDSVIVDMGLVFPDEEADRAIVRKALDSGDFAVHHSARFNKAYSRHYRIIRADIVDKMILPLVSGQ